LAALAPAARADDKVASQVEVTPSVDPSAPPPVDSSQPPADTTPPADTAAPADASQPSSTPPPTDQSPPASGPPVSTIPDTHADSAGGASSGGGDHSSSDPSASHAAGATTTVTAVSPDDTQTVVATPAGPSGPSSTVAGGTNAPGSTDVFFLSAVNTGGIRLLLTSSLPCGQTVCSAGSAGLFAANVIVNRFRPRPARIRDSAPKLSSLDSITGSPIRPGGTFFGLMGGGGSGGIAITLLAFVAVAATMLQRASWTTRLVPTATWRPSVYIPPLESPG
jgi:hypothetical protein